MLFVMWYIEEKEFLKKIKITEIAKDVTLDNWDNEVLGITNDFRSYSINNK